MSASLDGKVALVTGAGTSEIGVGTGAAAAIVFARRGASVLVADRDRDAALRTCAAIEKEGGTASAGSYDVTVPEDCTAMVDQAVETWGRLDVVDNNVGFDAVGAVTEFDQTRWNAAIDVNLRSVVLVSAAAMPWLARTRGSIVNISSISAFRSHRNAVYSAAKAGVIALTHAMALDHGQDGVRVNCVAPGPIYTPMVARGMSDDARDGRRRASVLEVEGTAWDVAYSAAFLASDEARYITGIVLTVDGGVSLRSPAR